jgi:hypothetical protein
VATYSSAAIPLPLDHLTEPRGRKKECAQALNSLPLPKLSLGRKAGFYTEKHSASRKAHHLPQPDLNPHWPALCPHLPWYRELPYNSLGNSSGICLYKIVEKNLFSFHSTLE